MRHTIKIFPLVLLLFSLNLCYGQKDKKDQEVLGATYASKGLSFYYSNQIDSAIYYTTLSSIEFKKDQDWNNYVCSLTILAFILDYNNQRGPKLTEIIFDAYNTANEQLSSTNKCSLDAKANMGEHYNSIGDISKAIKILKETLDQNIKNNSSKLVLATNYINLGVYQRSSGNYEDSFSYFKKALRFQLDTIPNDPLMAETYFQIGQTFHYKAQLDSAIFYLEKGEKLLEPTLLNSPYLNRRIENLINLAELWSEKEFFSKVNLYTEKVKQLSLSDFNKVLFLEKMGTIYSNQKKYSSAIKMFEEANLKADLKNVRINRTRKAKRLLNLAESYLLNENYDDAVFVFQKTLSALSPVFINSDFQQNPNASQLLLKPTALKALNGKAKSLQKLYEQKQDSSYLNAAYNTYLIATQLIRNMRQGYLNIDAKNTLAEKSVAIYEGAIQCALTLFDLTKDEKYKSEALALAESNKALLLLEKLNEQTAKGFSGIPDSLLEKEKDLKLNLAYLQKVALKEKTNNLKDDIFDLQQELDKFTTKLEKSYPRYFELKYQNEPISLKAIQAKLNNSALLEYFAGEENIYLFIVMPNGLDIKTIKDKEVVYDNIAKLRMTLNTIPGGINAQTEFEQFTTAANNLYNLLLKTALDQLPPDINTLTIIPDYQLNYIPFDVLLREAANPELPGYSAATLEYVMEKYAISYDYSATLLYKNQQREEKNYQYDFIGYAPSFKSGTNMANRSCSSDELYSLSCSDDEVQSINSLFRGITHLGSKANKETFEAAAGSSRILHLATHACIDEENSKVNKIFLTDDFLSNYDLYNMNLNAELAVLSACNTGSGELVKGEGVMSLARGFINAGCASTLMSMWSVDDCATSDIMVRFYEGLKNRLSKDQALREAKLSYLENASKSKTHPYYWAAFVQFGDVSVLDLKQSFNFKYLIGTVGVLLMIGLSLKLYLRL